MSARPRLEVRMLVRGALKLQLAPGETLLSASAPGEVAGIPFFRHITEEDDELQVENAEPLVDNIITVGQMKAVAAWAWSIAPGKRASA